MCSLLSLRELLTSVNSEHGASSWFLALPLGVSFSQARILDVLHLRYDWTLLNTPGRCVCGADFTADHAMICRHGGLTFVYTT